MEREQYPMFLIPDDYTLYRTGNPYPDRFDKVRPTEPVYEVYKKPSFNGCLEILMPFAILFALISIITFFKEKVSGPDVLLFFVCIIIFFLWIAVDKSSDNEKNEIARKNKIRRDAYLGEIEKYETKLKEFNKLKLIEADSESDLDYRNEKLYELLNNASKASIEYVGKKGVSEELFTNHLKKYFGEKILTNLVIETFRKHNPYQPDIIFYDEEYNIWIDIEIDEVYDITESKPLHYIDEFNSHVDCDRNEYFLSHGWFVIRFSEKQVLSNPLGCCKFINDILVEYFDTDDFSFHFANVKPLKYESCWTFDEAVKMISNKARIRK